MSSIDILISHLGGVSQTAAVVGVAQPVVSHWRRRGLPADRVLSVSRATGWQVTPHQLRPDIYPNPTDGLPPEVATPQQEAV